MKAASGNLRLDQSYKLEGQEYHGKFEDNFSAESCQNCGLLITNVAIVRGSVDNATYRIGLDCAATLTGIAPSEIAQAKKVMAREAACLKWIKTQCKMGVIDETGKYIALYDHIVTDWKANRKYDVTVQHYGETLKKAGIVLKTRAELHTERLAWIESNCVKATLSDGYVKILDQAEAAKNWPGWTFFMRAEQDVLDAITRAGVTPTLETR